MSIFDQLRADISAKQIATQTEKDGLLGTITDLQGRIPPLDAQLKELAANVEEIKTVEQSFTEVKAVAEKAIPVEASLTNAKG